MSLKLKCAIFFFNAKIICWVTFKSTPFVADFPEKHKHCGTFKFLKLLLFAWAARHSKMISIAWGLFCPSNVWQSQWLGSLFEKLLFLQFSFSDECGTKMTHFSFSKVTDKSAVNCKMYTIMVLPLMSVYLFALSFKRLWLVRLFLKEINAFIQQGCIKMFESDSKDIYNIRKDYFSSKCCSFELSIHLWILKNKMHHGFHKYMKQHNCFQH